MPPTVQTNPLPQIYLRRPLVSRETAAEALDKWAWEIDLLIEDGSLVWAFNLARKGSSQRFVRILAHSLAELQNGQRAPRLPEAEAFARVVKIIFPAVTTKPDGKTTVRATNIARRFNVDSEFVIALIKDGSFRMARGAVIRRGSTGSPAVDFSSVVEFLKQRRIA